MSNLQALYQELARAKADYEKFNAEHPHRGDPQTETIRQQKGDRYNSLAYQISYAEGKQKEITCNGVPLSKDPFGYQQAQQQMQQPVQQGYYPQQPNGYNQQYIQHGHTRQQPYPYGNPYGQQPNMANQPYGQQPMYNQQQMQYGQQQLSPYQQMLQQQQMLAQQQQMQQYYQNAQQGYNQPYNQQYNPYGQPIQNNQYPYGYQQAGQQGFGVPSHLQQQQQVQPTRTNHIASGRYNTASRPQQPVSRSYQEASNVANMYPNKSNGYVNPRTGYRPEVVIEEDMLEGTKITRPARDDELPSVPGYGINRTIATGNNSIATNTSKTVKLTFDAGHDIPPLVCKGRTARVETNIHNISTREIEVSNTTEKSNVELVLDTETTYDMEYDRPESIGTKIFPKLKTHNAFMVKTSKKYFSIDYIEDALLDPIRNLKNVNNPVVRKALDNHYKQGICALVKNYVAGDASVPANKIPITIDSVYKDTEDLLTMLVKDKDYTDKKRVSNRVRTFIEKLKEDISTNVNLEANNEVVLSREGLFIADNYLATELIECMEGSDTMPISTELDNDIKQSGWRPYQIRKDGFPELYNLLVEYDKAVKLEGKIGYLYIYGDETGGISLTLIKDSQDNYVVYKN